MAPKTEKRRRENQEVAAFVEELYELGGFESWADFGRQAGMNLASTVSDWKRGENAPNGYNLLRLIRAAQQHNRLALQGAAQASDPVFKAAAETVMQHRLAELEAKEAEFADRRARADARLRQDIAKMVAGLATKEEIQRGLDALRAAIDARANRGTRSEKRRTP